MTRLPDFGENPSTPPPPWDNAVRLRDLLENVRQTLRTAFRERIWVFAEAQEIKRDERGHVYLTLVDAQEGQVSTRAILWAGQGGQRLAGREEERGEALGKGEKIIIFCSPEYHTSYGFRLIANDVQFADTLGPAERRLRDALKRLAREGIIAKNRELSIPLIAFRIALITPRVAEGSLDFQQILLQERKRAPTIVSVYHAVFQSEGAAQEIPRAIAQAVATKPDLIVLVRGGGSKADLLYLNSYPIGRAICECPIPIWSGIGHSTDRTLVDEVANQEFKTPSDAAHRIVNLTHEAITQTYEFGNVVFRIASAITERFDHQIWRDWRHTKTCVIASLEKSIIQTNKLTGNSSHCGRIIAATSAQHLVLRWTEAKAGAISVLQSSSANTRGQARASITSSRLAQERWINALSNQRAAATRAAQALVQGLRIEATDLIETCIGSSRLGRERLEAEVGRLHVSIRSSAELCRNRISETIKQAFAGSTKRVEIALHRAFSETRRTTDAVANLLTIKVRSVEAETRQHLELCGQVCRSMLGRRKLVINNDLDLTKRSADVVVIRSRGALDKLLAGIEAADFRGPLKRGFVMVTDENERWLRTAAETVDQMRLLYSDGIVPVRKG